MRLSLLISLNLLLLSWRNAGAQLAPADDFFNSGAQFYISNNIPSALGKVETGLKFYPDDEKLKKLEQLLKQQQKSQSQQQKKQQQNQSSSQKNSESQQEREKQKPAEQKKAEQQKQQEQQNQAAAQKKEGEKKDQQNAEGQPLKPGQMTPEEAKRLLDAQKGDEQVLQFKPPQKPRDELNPVKDW
jgi:hypothetical protein